MSLGRALYHGGALLFYWGMDLTRADASAVMKLALHTAALRRELESK